MGRDTLDIGRSSSARPARSFVACACFAVGLMAARELNEINAGVWFSLACGACAVAAASRRAVCRVALCVAVGLVGAGWFAIRIWGSESLGLAAGLAGAKSDIVAVEGCVLDEPSAFASDGPLAAFAARQPSAACMLRIDSIGGHSAKGRLRLIVSGTEWSFDEGLGGFPVHAGDWVRATGTFRAMEGPENPGQADARLLGAQSGTLGTLRVMDARLFERLTAPSALRALEGRARGALARTREQVRRAIDPGPGAPAEARALILSLLLGIDESGIVDVRSEFTRLGLAHVLAISGFHLALLAGLATVVLRPFSPLEAGAPLLVAAAVAGYTLLVPAEAPVLRSAAMVLGLLLAESLGRRYDRLAILGWVTIGLLLWRPLDLWSLGFQLSIGLTAVLLWLSARLNARLFGVEIRGVRRVKRSALVRALRWIARHMGEALATTLLCSLVSLPLIAHTTGLVSPYTLLATLVVLPLSIALMAAGFACVFVSAILTLVWGDSPAFGDRLLTPLAGLTAGAADALDGLPFAAVYVPPIGMGATAALTVLAIYLLCYAPRRDVRPWLAIVAGVALVAGDQWLRVKRERVEELAITAINVEPGVCTLVRSRGDAILIDAGASTLARPRPTIPRACRTLGAWRVPTVVITGEDPARYGGILDCIEPLGVRHVIVATGFLERAEREPGGVQGTVLNELHRRSIEVREPGSLPIHVGDCTVELTHAADGSLRAVVIDPFGGPNPVR